MCTIGAGNGGARRRRFLGERRSVMNCPVDGAELQMTERQGIEIDYCPRCRGVWLDRGELDKLIERSAAVPSRDEPVLAREPRREGYRPEERDYEYRGSRDRDDDDRDDYRRRESGGYDPKKRKRRSFLEDLFDID